MSELRAHLRQWLERVRDGEEIVVTERGVPVARLVGLDSTATLERLAPRGVIASPANPARPRATGRRRPEPRRPVADIVSDQRR